MAGNLGLGLDLGVGVGSIAYLLRDDFTTDVAAGSVNGSAVVPGPGPARYVVDGGNQLAVSVGALISGTATSVGDPGLWYNQKFSRIAGRILISQITLAQANKGYQIGWDGTIGSALNRNGVLFRTTGAIAAYQSATAGPDIGAYSAGVKYSVATILRAAGACHFVKEGTGVWRLLYADNRDSGTNLYPGISTASTGAQTETVDMIRIPTWLWLPSPIASDGFTRSDGVPGSTDGLGHAEGVAGGIGSGGSGVSWTDSVGTWGISSGKAACSALSGGVGIATVNLSTANVHVIAAVTRSAGNAGIVLRYVDSSNYIHAYHDGTNAVMVKVVAGTPTTLVTAAAAYSDSADLVAMCDGTEFRLWYNNAHIGTGTDPALPGGTRIGLYTTDTGNTFDNFNAWARGTEGQYAFLSRY